MHAYTHTAHDNWTPVRHTRRTNMKKTDWIVSRKHGSHVCLLLYNMRTFIWVCINLRWPDLDVWIRGMFTQHFMCHDSSLALQTSFPLFSFDFGGRGDSAFGSRVRFGVWFGHVALPLFTKGCAPSNDARPCIARRAQH